MVRPRHYDLDKLKKYDYIDIRKIEHDMRNFHQEVGYVGEVATLR